LLFLAFDVGTSAVKSSLVNERGEIVSFADYVYPRDETCSETEQNPGLWWDGVCRTTRELVGRNPEYIKEIAAIGAGGHMLGCVPVDARGTPLRPAMLHSDTRAVREEGVIADRIGRKEIYLRTGNTLGAQSTLAKILWLKTNEPQVYDNTAKFLQSKDFITYMLTGNLDTSDYSDGAHAHLMDIRTKRPITDIFDELGIDAEKIPVFRRGTDIAGKLSDEAARFLGLPSGIPVITGGGDGACATAGSGITSGEMYCSLGTTAWLSYISTEPVVDKAARVFNIPALDGEGVGVYGAMQAAGRCVEWASELFGIPDVREFDRIAAEAPEGSAGLVFLPYIEGERSPIFDSDARGVYFRIGAEHGRAHFLRATLEGVTIALRSILDVYRENRVIDNIRIIGGGGNSPLWRQMIADILNVRAWSVTAKASSIGARGVALAAAVGIGVYRNLVEAGSRLEPAQQSFPRSEYLKLYDGLARTYTDLYLRLKDLFPAP
jgi:xylulokinase